MADNLVRLQVFGEPKGQPSRALPDGTMDTTTGQLAGVGMGAAATLLFAHLLKGAALWVPAHPLQPALLVLTFAWARRSLACVPVSPRCVSCAR